MGFRRNLWTCGGGVKGDFLGGVRRWNGEVGHTLGARGDFNTIRFPEERIGCRGESRVMEEFSEFIDNHCLIDLPLTGAPFTWSRSEDSSSRSRLDRFLVSTSWEELAPNVIQAPLPRLLSDHSPIMLDGSRGRQTRCPFRFENMWLRVNDFRDRVVDWWSSYEVEGRPSFRLAKKLKLLKKDIKVWNKEVFGRVKVKMGKIMNKVGELERIEVGRELDEREKEKNEVLIRD